MIRMYRAMSEAEPLHRAVRRAAGCCCSTSCRRSRPYLGPSHTAPACRLWGGGGQEFSLCAARRRGRDAGGPRGGLGGDRRWQRRRAVHLRGHDSIRLPERPGRPHAVRRRARDADYREIAEEARAVALRGGRTRIACRMRRASRSFSKGRAGSGCRGSRRIDLRRQRPPERSQWRAGAS